MTIPTFRHPSVHGEFVRYDDHNKEVEQLKEVINSLYDQVSVLGAMVEKLKPSENSKFVVMYKTEDNGYDHIIKYQRWFKHAVERVNKLSKDPEVFDVRAYALTEVPIVESLTLQLPE